MTYQVNRRRLLLIRRQEISPDLMFDEVIKKIHGATHTRTELLGTVLRYVGRFRCE